jgi:type 1 glutamine amidotransferase
MVGLTPRKALLLVLSASALATCQSSTEIVAVINNANNGAAGAGPGAGSAGDAAPPPAGSAGATGAAGSGPDTGAAGTAATSGTAGASGGTGAAGPPGAAGGAGEAAGATGAAGSGMTMGTAGSTTTRDGGTQTDGPASNGPLNVLVFNYTQGYGHQSRITAIPFLKTAAAANNINLDLQYAFQYNGAGQTIPKEGTNDSGQPLNLTPFTTPGGLDKYDVVFFLNTTGHVFQGAQEAAAQKGLQDYMEQHHGGFVGTHSATDTYDEDWQWYQDFVGSIYNGHSGVVSGSARYNTGVTHSILSMGGPVPNPWTRNEEWYVFRRDVRGLTNFTVLLLANAPDMSGAMAERPSAWVHDVPGGGRVFYTAFGHLVDAFKEPAFMSFLMAGIKWAGHRID